MSEMNDRNNIRIKGGTINPVSIRHFLLPIKRYRVILFVFGFKWI